MATQQTSNPSIGTIGEAYSDTTNNRTKGFFTTIHQSVAAARATLERALEAPLFGTRETYRILANRSVPETELKELEVGSGERRLHCEAVVPVRHHDVVANIAYYASNAPERRNDAATTSQEEMLLCSVVDQNRKARRHDHSAYTVQISTPDHITLDEGDIRTLAEIYQQTFTTYLTELNTRAVQKMIEGNVVAVVRDENGKIAAVAMAEVAQIPLATSNPLRIAEISEVATHPLHQRRGLSHLACLAVMNYLRMQNIHAMFMEARANHFAMMAVAHDCKMSPRGWLTQHCLIASPFAEVQQETSYGDLMVFSL